MFFLTYPSNYEEILKEEIWGCFKYIGIPIDTVMSMPINDRKFFINKHNEVETGKAKNSSKDKTTNTFEGSALNAYAHMDQKAMRGE